MEAEKRYCSSCGRPLVGRADKKYCDGNCKNAHNNRQNSDAHNLRRQINYALRKNQRLLRKLVPIDGDTVMVAKQKMIELGFNFKYHTHLYVNPNGLVYYYSYDYGYVSLAEDRLLLVRYKEPI